jgi:delta14-sterol reductase
MMGWLLINLSVLAKSIQDGTLSKSMILFQLFCAVISKTCILSFVDRKTHLFIIIFIFLISAHLFQLYILDYFVYEEYMTST